METKANVKNTAEEEVYKHLSEREREWGRQERELGKMILSCSISLLSSEISGWCHATMALIHRVQTWTPAGLQSTLSSAGQRGLQIRMEEVDHPLKGHFTGEGTLKHFLLC